MTEPSPPTNATPDGVSVAAIDPPLPGVLGRLAESIGDRLNPILVKETRQSLKSRQFTLWFILLLAACWVTTIGAIAMIGPSIFYVSAGAYFLYAYYIVLALPLIVVAPFSAYRSLSSEQEDNTRDLLEVSSLTPRQVINGKLGSAALQIVVYSSAVAPCIAFTYLLRGVEMRTVGLLLTYTVLASLGLSVLGLLAAAASRRKSTQVVTSISFAGGLFAAFSGLLAVAGELLWMNSNDLHSEFFWWINLGVFSLYATSLVIAYAAAVSFSNFASANRSTGLRIATLIQQVVYVAWVAGMAAAFGPEGEPLLVCFGIGGVYWFVAGAILSSESPTLSLRVRRALPQSWLGRALGTWLNPGGGSGYVFAVTNLATLAVLTAAVALLSSMGGSTGKTVLKSVGLFFGYVVAYLGVGRLAVLGLRRVADLSLVGGFLVQVLFALACCGLPFVIDTLTDRMRVADYPVVNYPSAAWNVPRMLESKLSWDNEVALLVTVGAVALTVLLVNLVLAGHEARQLRVAAPLRVQEDELEQHAADEPEATNPWGDRPKTAAESPG